VFHSEDYGRRGGMCGGREDSVASGKRSNGKKSKISETETYRHKDAESLLRPEVGVQAQFRKRKLPATYRYDSSLAPELYWDAQNPARELGEWLIAVIADAAALPPPHRFDKPRVFADAFGRGYPSIAGLDDAVYELRRLGKPFLNWAGKAERLSFEVPTLPLFVHERLSTKGIIETLKGQKRDPQFEFDLFGDPRHSVTDQVLRAYEYKDEWVNRMILGDSLVVMNSLLRYEGMGGQVQMIYIDPPYGVKFGSNFQPFVRKRDVGASDDEDMTREPEMVKAYRDTWELGLHSYLTYLRDRLLLARELLSPSGSVFVQISDENLHHVRNVMDEVFGEENFVVTIVLKKKGATTPTDPVNDYILWFARDIERAKPRIQRLFERRRDPEDDPKFNTLIGPSGQMVRTTELSESEATHKLAQGMEMGQS
jgi:adenine-specific DNA-methyltransferase